MDADSKLEHAKKAIRFVAFSHEDGEIAVKAHLAHLRKFIDDVEAQIPAERAKQAAVVKAIADRKDAARKAREEAAAKAAA